MILRAYEYLFFKLYQWSIKVNGADYYNKASACFMVSAVLILNAITAMVVIDLLTGIGPTHMPKSVGVIFAGVCWAINYTYFSYRGRYLTVIERYNSESSNSAKRGNMIVTSYVIGSFVLMGVSGFLGIYISQAK